MARGTRCASPFSSRFPASHYRDRSFGQARIAGRWIAILLLAFGGCGNDATAADASADTDVPPPRIVLPATRADILLVFVLDANGAGSAAIGDLSISGNVGTVTVNGVALAALAYAYTPWPAIGFDVYQALVVAPDRWYVLWLYCEANELISIWLEGTDGTRLDNEPASGSCVRMAQPSAPWVEFPAVDMSYPALEPGFTISGANLRYDGASPGAVTLDGIDMVLLPFQGVDCRSCGGTGWWELHALLYDPARERACYGMLYMDPQEPDRVDLANSLTLPDLSDPAGLSSFVAGWDTP